jgi:alkylation response protein AidB-like acyl-CoA dehydrogenase
MSAAYLEPAVAKRLFSPANAILAWGAGAQGRAVPADGGYRISGSWDFASGSRHATLLGAHCKLYDDAGEPRLGGDGRHLELTALLPRAKAHIRDTWQVIGLRGTGSDSYDIEDLFVPTVETFTREAQFAHREPGTLYRFPAMNAYAGAFAGVMLGIARGALSDLRALARTKTPRGAPSSLQESPVFQNELAVLEARFRAARLLHLSTLDSMWNAVDAGSPLTLDMKIDARLASTFAINEGHDIVTQVYRAAGQTAIFDQHPFERRLRDANAASQQVQGRPGHFTTVGRHLLGLAPDSMMFL